MKKKTISVLLAVAMSAAMLVTGCGEKQTETEETTTQTEESTGTTGDEFGSEEGGITANVTGGETIDSFIGTGTRTYDLDVAVTLCDVASVTIPMDKKFEVSEEEINQNVDFILSYYYTDYKKNDKTVVENGDYVNIDYCGKKDGVAFDGGTAEGYDLGIGTGTFIPGFEEGLIGAKVGEEIDLNLKFPEQYQSAELAGQEVVFTVKVNYIEDFVFYDHNTVTDEFVAANMDGFDTVEDFRNEVISYMQEDIETEKESAEKTAALNYLIDNSTVAVPEGLVESEVNRYEQQASNQVTLVNGTDLENYLSANGMTIEDFRTNMTTQMENEVEQELILEAAAKALNVSVDEDGLTKYLSNTMTSSGVTSLEELYMIYTSDYESGEAFLKHRYLLTKTLTTLKDSVTFTYPE